MKNNRENLALSNDGATRGQNWASLGKTEQAFRGLIETVYRCVESGLMACFVKNETFLGEKHRMKKFSFYFM